jgi:hypothetical protein
MSKIIMALDQGTTSSRTILYNEKGEPIAMAKDSGIKIKNVKVDGAARGNADELLRSGAGPWKRPDRPTDLLVHGLHFGFPYKLTHSIRGIFFCLV